MNKTIIIAAFIFAITGAAAVGYSAGIFVRPVTDVEPVTTNTPDRGIPSASADVPDTSTQPAQGAPTAGAPAKPSASAGSGVSSGGTATKPTPSGSGTTGTSQTSSGTAPSGSTNKGITMATVAQHASESDCWVVVNGKAYNMTSYIPFHPGGRKAISRECGGDGTSAFNGERAHSRSSVMEEMAQFYVGNVTN